MKNEDNRANDVNKNAKPFFYKGKNNIICLLVHGFTGSPSEIKELGRYLNKNGYWVSAPLLKGHGTSVEDMEKTNWKDWYESVQEEYLKLTKDYKDKTIIPIGLSMGSTLVLHLAYNYKFSGIVTMCPGLYFYSKKIYFSPIIQYFTRFIDKKSLNLKYDVDDQFYYEKTPVKSIVSQLFMVLKVRRELKHINSPCLIIQSKDDKTVASKAPMKLYKAINNKNNKIIWINNSGHIITLGQNKKYVFKKIKNFISKT